jgi:hypothetical protein
MIGYTPLRGRHKKSFVTSVEAVARRPRKTEKPIIIKDPEDEMFGILAAAGLTPSRSDRIRPNS